MEVTYPPCSSRFRASRMVGRLRCSSAIMARSEGSRSPGFSAPEVMRARSCSINIVAGPLGRIQLNVQFVGVHCAASFPLNKILV